MARLRAVFALPALLAVASLAGLLVALLGNGAHDVFAWFTLASPVAAAGWAMLRARRSR